MRLCRVGATFFVFLVAISTQGAEDSKLVSPPFARTPQRVVRGKYLTELAHCFDCHSERDAKGNQVPRMKGEQHSTPAFPCVPEYHAGPRKGVRHPQIDGKDFFSPPYLR